MDGMFWCNYCKSLFIDYEKVNGDTCVCFKCGEISTERIQDGEVQ